MPMVIGGHYVTYVLNLKDKRFEYLNSLQNKYPRIGEYERLGNVLMEEAKSYVDSCYAKAGKQTQSWDEWRWVEPHVPQQPDKTSCGVFTMKYMDEWDGLEDGMFSFSLWDRFSTYLKRKEVRQLRMDLCTEILNHKSNEIIMDVRIKAEEYGKNLKNEWLKARDSNKQETNKQEEKRSKKKEEKKKKKKKGQ